MLAVPSMFRNLTPAPGVIYILICVILKNVAENQRRIHRNACATFMSVSSGMTQYFYPYFCGSKCIFMVNRCLILLFTLCYKFPTFPAGGLNVYLYPAHPDQNIRLAMFILQKGIPMKKRIIERQFKSGSHI
jgi:hypothetical protein